MVAAITEPVRKARAGTRARTRCNTLSVTSTKWTLAARISRDPIKELGGLNLYTFAFNTPVNIIDSDGRQCPPIILNPGTWRLVAEAFERLIIVAGISYEVYLITEQAEITYQKFKEICKQCVDDGKETKPDTRTREETRTPANGDPNSTKSFPDGRGGRTDREYGPDGRAKKDTDYGHDHGKGDPHTHDWDWTKTPPRQ